MRETAMKNVILIVTLYAAVCLAQTAPTIMWQKSLGGSDEDDATSIQQTSDGGFIVAGYTGSFGAGLNDVYLVKTDAYGDTIWTRTYSGSDDDRAYSVAQTSDGGYIVAGYTGSFGAGSADVYLIKTDSLGYTAIEESPSAKPEAFAITAQPNPFNSAVRITIETPSLSPSQAEEMPQAEGVVVEIFDLNGRRIETPRLSADPLLKGVSVDGLTPLTKGGQGGSFIWQPAAAIGSGVYLVRAKTDGGATATKRVVYLK